MAREKIYFLSDLHLGAAYFDDPLRRERHIVEFLDSIGGDAAEIFLLGDILDYWYEYRYVVPKGFVRFFGALARLSDAGVKITWIVGNHDIWIFDYLPSELGITVVDGAITRTFQGITFYMAHGDDAGIDSWKFRFIRSLFRNRVCQKMFSAIHPRWTVPFAHRWSGASRKAGQDRNLKLLRENSFLRLKKFSEQMLEKNPSIRFFLFGHLHCLRRETIAGGAQLIVLGDWISEFSYAVLDRGELKIAKFPLD